MPPAAMSSSPPSGTAPSETTMTGAYSLRKQLFTQSHTRATVNGRSGTMIAFAPPAMPACRAIQPAWRPITSQTSARRCDSAVVRSRSTASVAMCTAVSKPNV